MFRLNGKDCALKVTRRSHRRAPRKLGAIAAGALLAMSGLAGSVMADQPPNTMSYQGVLRQNGVAATGTYSMVFRFFSDSAAGVEILVNTHPAVNVAGGLFTVYLGTGTMTDGSGAGTYTALNTVFRDYSQVWLQIEVDGVVQNPRQPLSSAPGALNARRSHSLDDVLIVGQSNWTVTGLLAELTIGGTNLNLFLGDSNADLVTLQGTLRMVPESGTDADQSIRFRNGGTLSEAFTWDDSDDRFELSDGLALAGTLQAGSTTIADVPYNRIGSGTPTSALLDNSNDLLITDDLEVLSTMYVGGDIRLNPGAPDGDSVIYFRENGSNTGENFRWDDSADKFIFSDAVQFDGNLTLNDPDGVSDIQSTGGVTIRIDTDNNESGPSNGVFAIVANQPDVFGTPLLRLQSTDEANLELDNGVVTDAFDFAEAFRAAPGHEGLEPGDLVALAVGEGLHEHCRMTEGAQESVVLGVVSTNPAYTAGMSFEAIEQADPALTEQRNAARARGDLAEVVRLEAEMSKRMREIWKPIAMVGRVPTKVDGRYGPIKAGDYLVASPTPGHAMKMAGPGLTIGVALEDYSGPGAGVISVFVRPMWHAGETPTGAQAQGPNPAGDERVAALERENAALRERLERIEAALAPKVAGK